MKKMTKIAAFVGASLLASGAHAADWNVTQTADVTVPAPSLSQGATTNVASSNQALNGIALDNTEDDLASGSQTANPRSSPSGSARSARCICRLPCVPAGPASGALRRNPC